MGFCRPTRYAPLLLVVILVACKDDQSGVEVKDLSFTGNAAVSTDQLKSVLATAESAKLPWGTKEYFSREEFEADLKRVVAFYRDRGYPDARVRSFDARLSDDQKSVRLRLDIEEGEPIRVERVVLTGLDPVPDEHRELGRFLALGGKAWNPFALAGRYLLVRNDAEAALWELPRLVG